jgi:hypothetical protein
MQQTECGRHGSLREDREKRRQRKGNGYVQTVTVVPKLADPNP